MRIIENKIESYAASIKDDVDKKVNLSVYERLFDQIHRHLFIQCYRKVSENFIPEYINVESD